MEKYHLTNEEKNERKKLLLNMKKEINILERKIKYKEIEDIKRKVNKNLRIMGTRLKFISPYIISAIILTPMFATTKITPFVKDNVKQELQTRKEIDSNGNTTIQSQYADFNSHIETISCFDKWEKTDNNSYKRKIEIYNIKKKKLTDIAVELINKNDSDNLEEIFGKPIIRTEEKSNLTDKEINQDAYMQVVLYESDKNDYIIVEESSNKNVVTTIIYMLSLIIAEWSISTAVFNKSYIEGYIKKIKEIKEKYESLTTYEELKEKLKIKVNNYERLTGE